MRTGQTLFLAAAILLAGTRLPGATGTISLLPEARVEGTAIYLSDLLPRQASPEMRAQAESILIGAAPQPGSLRALSGPAVAHILETAGAGTYTIPDQIVVRRAGRAITREEVIAAIRSSLNHNALSDMEFRPEDVSFSAPLIISGDPQLQVTRMELDSGLKLVKFLIRSRADSSLIPFLVTVRRSGSGAPLADLKPAVPRTVAPASNGRVADILTAAASAKATGVEAEDTATTGPDVVFPGHTVRLNLISGASMRMSLDVNPLERGAAGQKILVKYPPTGKVFHVLVVGPGLVEAAL